MSWNLANLVFPHWFVRNCERKTQCFTLHLQNQLADCRVNSLFSLARRLTFYFNEPDSMIWMLCDDIRSPVLRMCADDGSLRYQGLFGCDRTFGLAFSVLAPVCPFHSVDVNVDTPACTWWESPLD